MQTKHYSIVSAKHRDTSVAVCVCLVQTLGTFLFKPGLRVTGLLYITVGEMYVPTQGRWKGCR